MAFTYNTGPCRVCGKVMSSAGFAVKAHMDMHARNGELVTVYRWSWRGVEVASRRIPPADLDFWQQCGWFKTFEDCKRILGEPHHKIGP
jgi:hypothetical protein